MLLRSNSYAAAEGWDYLVHAFIDSLKNSSLDEMILLVHTTIFGPHERRSGYIRLVSYAKLGTVPRLLLMTPSVLRTNATPAHHQQLHVEVTARSQPDGDPDEQKEPKRIDDIPPERIVDRKEAEVVVSGGDHGEEIDETNADRKGIDVAQAQYWRLLHERSTEMGLSENSRYYLLFRTPLAYVLVCLDAIGAFAQYKKKGANKRMRTAGQKDLDELVEAHKQYRYDTVERPSC